MTLQIGARLGHYRIVSLLGRGGMADVYRAEDERLGREVALKAVPPEFARDPERIERFEREVRAAAGLTHPNIVTVYEFGQGEGQHFYTMELMPGGDLKSQIRAHPDGMPAAEAVSVAAVVARALDYAHKRGFVHRDVKPENILFGEDGTPQLTDFGIARAMSEGTGMTAPGMSIGSPHYMSPEQARGLAVDGRSDLYSLGVVLYEMFTGRLPFDAGDTLAVAYAHVNDPVPELPGAVARWQPVVDRLLAKSPQDRYGSAGELAADLSGEARSQAPAGRAMVAGREEDPRGRVMESATRVMARPKAQRRMVVGLVGAGLALAVVGIGYVGLRDTHVPRPRPTGGGGGGQVSRAPARPNPQPRAGIAEDLGGRQPTRTKRVREAAHEGVAAERALGLDRGARRLIQEGLTAAGFDAGGADGVVGPGTRAALRAWQKKQGKPATGYLTQESAAELREEGGRAGSENQARNAMEQARKAVEQARKVVEQARKTAEQARKTAEQARKTVEQARKTAEQARKTVPSPLLERLRRRAEQGDAVAQRILGQMYEHGRQGVPKDDREAARWYRKAVREYQKAAEQGNAAAQNTLGYMYEQGQGVAKDYGEAMKWYQKAAKQGNAAAQYNLGRMYEHGQGVPKDDREAARWYRKGADQGHALAESRLAALGAN